MTRPQVKRKLKKELNLTYYKLGRMWGVTSGMISNYLNGKTPSAPLDEKLAALMNCTVDDLPGRRRAA
jgi:transcriptional regulator with XRE-family HTH domain